MRTLSETIQFGHTAALYQDARRHYPDVPAHILLAAVKCDGPRDRVAVHLRRHRRRPQLAARHRRERSLPVLLLRHGRRRLINQGDHHAQSFIRARQRR